MRYSYVCWAKDEWMICDNDEQVTFAACMREEEAVVIVTYLNYIDQNTDILNVTQEWIKKYSQRAPGIGDIK